MAEADAFLEGAGEEGAEGGGAALADEADGAAESVGAAGGGGRPDVGLDIGNAEAVGAADAEAGLAGKSANFGLQVAAVVQIAFGEAGGDDDGGAGSLGVAFLEDVEDLVVGDNYGDEVGSFGEVGDGWVGFDAHNFGVTGVDGIDVDPVLGFEGGVEETAAVLHSGGCADYGNGFGVEHPVDGCQLLVGPDSHLIPQRLGWKGGGGAGLRVRFRRRCGGRRASRPGKGRGR